VKSTPRKRTQPKKKAVLKDSDSNDEEGSQFDETPSKKQKGGLNKTKGGRVTKSTPTRAARPAPGQYAEVDDEDDTEDLVKDEMENDSGSAHHSGSNHGYGNNDYSPHGAHIDHYSLPGSAGNVIGSYHGNEKAMPGGPNWGPGHDVGVGEESYYDAEDYDEI
jgi:hypothetical protein